MFPKAPCYLGLLSWHMYPDLNVVEPAANVQFHDQLLRKGGIVILVCSMKTPQALAFTGL